MLADAAAGLGSDVDVTNSNGDAAMSHRHESSTTAAAAAAAGQTVSRHDDDDDYDDKDNDYVGDIKPTQPPAPLIAQVHTAITLLSIHSIGLSAVL